MNTRIELNSNKCSLDGVYLIEASAGTGKTYNIQNLAVRLIVEKNLTIEQILIVTFTRAATAELSDRIRSIIQSSFDYLDQLLHGKIFPDHQAYSREFALLENALGDFSDMEKIRTARTKLQKALLDFDSNAISTIHGFCQRMLKKNAFESGILFQTDLTDSGEIREVILNLIRNQWREICYAPENRKYVGLYRGLIHFDQSFETEAEVSPEEYQLQSGGGFWGNTKAEYVSGYVPPGLNDFIGLIEKTDMEFDCEEEQTPSELAEAIFFELENLPEIDPEREIPDIDPKRESFSVDDLLSCQFEYGYGWKQFESLIFHADFNRWVEENGAEVLSFCEKMQTISSLMFRFRVSLLQQIRHRTAAQLSALKQQENFQTYDDLQKRMKAALNSPGSTLAETLRQQFKAAIIDEFQDTDQGQYEIFTKVFAPGISEGKNCGSTLFFVGDPKQAIYAFRGGDIFTYKGAAADVGERNILTLNRNFRSADSLVTAVNEIFSSHNLPFADQSIQFENVESSGKKTLKFNGVPDPSPFHYLSGGKNKKKHYESCVEKIYQLLTSNVQLPDPEDKDEGTYIPVKPSDIAVLFRKTSDLHQFLELLQQKGIPYVTDLDCNIYDTQEARDLEKLLLAVLNPTDVKFVTWLMQTQFVPDGNCRTLCEQNKISEGKSPSAKIQEICASLKLIFEQKGFPAMFREFMKNFRIYERYPAMPLGEQKFSNLIRLRDVLTAEEKRDGKTPGMLALWLQKQIFPLTRSDIGSNTILPTDMPAVRIMTIHKSKGLQFPIVFLPDLASGKIEEKRSKNYHHPDRNNRIFHRISSGFQTDLAVAESLQEELRIAYVALTRASRASYLLIPEQKPVFNVINWLYTAREIPADTPPEELKRTFEALEKVPLASVIGATRLEAVTWSDETYTMPLGKELSYCQWGNTKPPAPTPRISYSSAHKYFRRNEKISRSEEETSGEIGTGKHSETVELEDVFTLPRGDLFGTACHTIMEKWDFSKPENLKDLIRRYLSVVNIGEKAGIAETMFRNVVTAPLPQENGTPFTLQELSLYDRCAEMDFDFKLNRNFSPAQIASIMNNHYRERLEIEKIEPLTAIRSQDGDETFYTGSADLIFRCNGKFYIVDWKTDVLEKNFESFEQDKLFSVMWRKFYLYQSLLYSAALIRFLSLRLKKSPREVYEEDFGGVRYLFLRGIDPAAPGRGMYADKPDFELICNIAEVE